MTPKPSLVKVIPAGPAVHPRAALSAAKYGIKIELCGESETERHAAWSGYVYSHAVLGESEHAYESAEDCAEAGMRALMAELQKELS